MCCSSPPSRRSPGESPSPASAVTRSWARLRFRAQRRWRVEATQHLRLLPAYAGLDRAQLGQLAGHLQRRGLRARDGLEVGSSAAIYVRRGELHAPRLRLARGAHHETSDAVHGGMCVRADLILLPANTAALGARHR